MELLFFEVTNSAVFLLFFAWSRTRAAVRDYEEDEQGPFVIISLILVLIYRAMLPHTIASGSNSFLGIMRVPKATRAINGPMKVILNNQQG